MDITNEPLTPSNVQSSEHEPEHFFPVHRKLPKLLFVIVFILILLAVLFYEFLTHKNITPTKQVIYPLNTQHVNVLPTSYPTQDPLKVYENKQLGLTFEYPRDWIITPNNFTYEDNTNTVIGHGVLGLVLGSFAKIYSTLPGGVGTPPPSFTLEYWDNPQNVSLQAYNQTLSESSGFNFGLYSPTFQLLTIDGLPSYHDPKATCDPAFCDQYIIVDKTKFIEIERLYPDQTHALPDSSMAAIFNQIISSLKFK